MWPPLPLCIQAASAVHHCTAILTLLTAPGWQVQGEEPQPEGEFVVWAQLLLSHLEGKREPFKGHLFGSQYRLGMCFLA